MTEHRGEQKQGVGMVGKAIDAVGGIVGAVKATLGSKTDTSFITNASRSDVYEIEAGRIAQQRARSPELQRFAARMIQDHTDSSARLMEVLKRHGDASLLDEIKGDLDAHRKTMVEHLRKASDEEFDSIYLGQQAAAHREAMTLFEGFDGSDGHPELIAYARATIPVLQEHKAMLDRIEGKGDTRI